ncbi:hypothetical protein PR001_g23914 [Phytophthora rubi]|uniref:Uncharacterized protein n=1 Tax=Phytophthora rubi TaxID=129364 RepID=A0A6A3IX23_9STRA|nr:hypothetical protein PR001_g23914 [Phytophthora rubi]KAE8987659.1 hypothetical protein PR002_g21987 [Phytophthora rubi]
MAHEALVEWLKLRKEYEEYTNDRCKDGKEDVAAVMKSVKSSFDANVLETLCEIQQITDSFQNQELPDVKELFREELRMNMSNSDIDARVIEYFHLCNSLIKNMASLVSLKEKCKLIVCSLPKGLKSKVQNELDYRVPEAKCNIRKLYELVRVKAKEEAIEERARRKQTRLVTKMRRKNTTMVPNTTKYATSSKITVWLRR